MPLTRARSWRRVRLAPYASGRPCATIGAASPTCASLLSFAPEISRALERARPCGRTLVAARRGRAAPQEEGLPFELALGGPTPGEGEGWFRTPGCSDPKLRVPRGTS